MTKEQELEQKIFALLEEYGMEISIQFGKDPYV